MISRRSRSTAISGARERFPPPMRCSIAFLKTRFGVKREITLTYPRIVRREMSASAGRVTRRWFTRTASYHFDVERFFTKWLADLAAEQSELGFTPKVVPNALALLGETWSGAAWGDAAVICPWQIYLTYGNPDILRRQFHSMKAWVDYITKSTTEPDLWMGGEHYGDWLGLDAPSGSYQGSSSKDLIASAFYAYDTQLVARAGRLLGLDMDEYEALYRKIRAAFQVRFAASLKTQTEYAVAVYFDLLDNLQKAADELASLVISDGERLQTGFVGTPYLLHVLSRYGYTKLAYHLLLRTQYPSWLYSVTKGATTVWEHWDGIMTDGGFWSPDMNSFNHYAYGAVADWVYGVAAGIQTVPEAPGFRKIVIAPQPDERLGSLSASIDTRHGLVRSCWRYDGGVVRYEIETPSPTEIHISGKVYFVEKGTYLF